MIDDPVGRNTPMIGASKKKEFMRELREKRRLLFYWADFRAGAKNIRM
jgi:hypothetical protein